MVRCVTKITESMSNHANQPYQANSGHHVSRIEFSGPGSRFRIPIPTRTEKRVDEKNPKLQICGKNYQAL